MLSKYFKFIPWIIIAILLSVMSISKCSRDNHVEKPFDSTVVYKSKLEAIQKQGEELRKKWVSDSLEIKASEIKYKRVATKATKERDQARAKIQYLYDSIPEVKEFVQLDSVSDKINLDRIRELGLENNKISEDCRLVVDNLDHQLKLSYNLNEYLQSENEKLWQDFKKQRNWTTFWKWCAAVLGVAVVAQSLDVF